MSDPLMVTLLVEDKSRRSGHRNVRQSAAEVTLERLAAPDVKQIHVWQTGPLGLAVSVRYVRKEE